MEALSVLLVEDQLVNQRVAIRMLEKLGHKVVLAENGKEALQKLDEESFDLVLMDCQMPEMDGYQATEAIRQSEQNYRNIPIVALTGNTSEEDLKRCLQVGMNECMTKPFTKAELARMLPKALGELLN